MKTTKLTLSADRALIQAAKRYAAQRRTSLSAMFSRFLASTVRTDAYSQSRPLGPVTLRATGLAKLPEGVSAREMLEQALEEKYGIADK